MRGPLIIRSNIKSRDTMAIHDCINKDLLDSDEEGPLIIRRTDTTSRNSTQNSSTKSLSLQAPPRGENTYSRRSKVCPEVEIVAKGSNVARENASNSRNESLDKHKPAFKNSHLEGACSGNSDDHKPLIIRSNIKSRDTMAIHDCINKDLLDSDYKPFVPRHTKVTKQMNSVPCKKIKEETCATENSDDDKPLIFKRNLHSAAHTKQMNSLPCKKLKEVHVDEDSDDDKPIDSIRQKVNSLPKMHGSGCSTSPHLQNIKTNAHNNGNVKVEGASSSKIPTNSGLGSSKKRSYDSIEKKPSASMIQQNSSFKREPNGASKSIINANKRPLGSILNSVQSSNKKVKLSDSPAPSKTTKKLNLKEESRQSSDSDDYVPISRQIKKTISSNNKSPSKPVSKRVISKPIQSEKNVKRSNSSKVAPGSGEGQKWTTLEHNGVIFPPPYKPHGIKILYNGKPVDLTPEQEEVATMFAVMKDTEYAKKKTFLDNFMSDWKSILGANHVIKKLELCDFTPIYDWHMREKEKKKEMSAEEKKVLKEEKLQQEEKFMWAIVDGVKERVGNFRVEPPGLFRGRGEHPKMGKLKRRIFPHDITINIGKSAPIPKSPIPGERWKEIKHDNTVTWLAFWNDPINIKEFKYVFLAASSSLKGQSDKEKYEKARMLKEYIHNIRANYTRDFNNKNEMKRQIAVATYLIDKLALRAGNEKDDDEADTVGCCTLKVENVTLVQPNKLQFDFLGKDSIRYFNTVEVELPVYKAIGEFRKVGEKENGDDLFDKLDTSKLNAHLKELMPGLTAKVFRTYNASITLDQMLNKETKDGIVPEKIAVYQSANKEVAIICNHQRSVSKSHEAQMTRFDTKITELKDQQEELKDDLNRIRKGKPLSKDKDGKAKRNLSSEALEKKLSQIDAKIEKIELDKRLKEDLKTVALGTSKINYLDPRISVAWCKRNEVPIEKIFNKSLLAKFSWAMDAEPTFRF
ncbi:DNA topoisomerase 1 [Zostera marina]|uniref:DNA topoisomerase I n=1 Tax=Zostera marina TaxID=29655 RepID=A0A0K9NK99_ZOSMR|nr:DNA topoisomerase 1 [Zostera marina]